MCGRTPAYNPRDSLGPDCSRPALALSMTEPLRGPTNPRLTTSFGIRPGRRVTRLAAPCCEVRPGEDSGLDATATTTSSFFLLWESLAALFPWPAKCDRCRPEMSRGTRRELQVWKPDLVRACMGLGDSPLRDNPGYWCRDLAWDVIGEECQGEPEDITEQLRREFVAGAYMSIIHSVRSAVGDDELRTSALQEKLGVTKQAISKWMRRPDPQIFARNLEHLKLLIEAELPQHQFPSHETKVCAGMARAMWFFRCVLWRSNDWYGRDQTTTHAPSHLELHACRAMAARSTPRDRLSTSSEGRWLREILAILDEYRRHHPDERAGTSEILADPNLAMEWLDVVDANWLIPYSVLTVACFAPGSGGPHAS